MEGAGVTNKMHRKKLVMSASRLQKQAAEFPAGTEFDSSKDSGPYKFTLGQNKVIKAWEASVATMKVGEKAEIKCRFDSAYGADGFRKKSGEVVIPPFATLLFQLNRVE